MKWFDSRLLAKMPIKPTTKTPQLFLSSFTSMKFGNSKINKANETQYSEVYINSNLKWEAHVKCVFKKLRLLLYKLEYISSHMIITQMETL